MKIFSRALLAIAALASLTLSSPAFAADNTTGKDASGATISLRCVDTNGSGLLACVAVLGDHLGAPIDPATAGKQDTGNTSLGTIATNIVPPYAATVTTTITRPADTTLYTVNDAWADSTSAPTTGGFTLANACRTSGGSGILTGVSIMSSVDPASVLLQGELWLADSAVTAVNDNAVFALSDGDAAKIVPGGVVPFALATSQNGSGTNSIYTASNLNIPFTCVGTANLRFLVKVKNGYTPASGEVLTIRAAVVATN